MRALIALLLVVCAGAICAACVETGRSPLPENVARTLKTPDGSEVKLVCPPSLADDPVKMATAMAGFNIHTPSSIYPALTAAPPIPANALNSVIPRESSAGSVDCCSTETNKDFGAPFGGAFASEEQLIQMGRLCGIRADSPAVTMRVDLYTATAGAEEAYRREADTMMASSTGEGVEPQNSQLLASIGDKRLLRRILTIVNGQRIDNDGYELLFARRNVIARMRLSYGSFWAPAKGPPEPLLQYAAQLDGNIEAAAQQ
jgi:hypothetical protein